MMANNMMASLLAEREYMRSVVRKIWDDGIRSGRSSTDTSWYLLYMQGFLRMFEEEAYKLMNEIEEKAKKSAEQSMVTAATQDEE